jgi:hypothetical protein
VLLPANIEAQTLLRWKFSPGQKLNHTLSLDSSTSMNFAGQAIETTVALTVDSVWTIDRVDPLGTAEITQTFPRVRMKMVSPVLGSTDVDTASETAAASPAAKGLKSITQSKVTLSMNSQGETANVQVVGLDGKPVVAAELVAGMFGKDGIASIISQSTYPLPKDPLAKGATWSRTLDMDVPMLGKASSTTTLTLAGPAQVSGKSLEQVNLDTTMAINPKSAANPLAQITIKEQSDKGAFYFDKAAGRFSHSESVQTMKMQVMAVGQNIEQSIRTVRKVTLSPAEQ